MLPSLWTLDLGRLPGVLGKLGKKELHLWLGAWLRDRLTKKIRRVTRGHVGPRHLFFATCDHYEPLHGGVDLARGLTRVRAWRERYPLLADSFRDADGRPPRHSFFYPGEQYSDELVEPIAELVEGGYGEVEVHLHHDGDTRATLRAALEKTLSDLSRHGVVSRSDRGAPRFAFIHGNWCLANGRRDGRYCGVDDELDLLYELGCYADFTFPSAPDGCQPGVVNAIYWPRGDVRARRAYERAELARVAGPVRDKVLLIEGPIAISGRPGRPGESASRLPRIESAAIDAGDPPSAARLTTWIDQEVSVVGRPDWLFVKVHTHGAPEGNAALLLGDANRAFHEELGKYNDGERFILHYVTAREMFNLARAAIAGRPGPPVEHFDAFVAPPARARRDRRVTRSIDGVNRVNPTIG